MKIAILIGAVTCAACADETFDTMGDWDQASYTFGWKKVGQTMVVPDDASVLESFTFVPYEWGPGGGTYILQVYNWHEAGQHADGPVLFSAPGVLPSQGGMAQTHEIGLLLPKGQKIVIMARMNVDDLDDVGVGFDLGLDFEGGALVATNGTVEQTWEFQEADLHDMAFSAEFVTCVADMNGDGVLSILDFVAFQSAFLDGSMDADCNGDGILNVLDFVCFQDEFVTGC